MVLTIILTIATFFMGREILRYVKEESNRHPQAILVEPGNARVPDRRRSYGPR